MLLGREFTGEAFVFGIGENVIQVLHSCLEKIHGGGYWKGKFSRYPGYLINDSVASGVWSPDSVTALRFQSRADVPGIDGMGAPAFASAWLDMG